MKVDVFMPIYIGDYLKDTFGLTAEEHGAYLLLLMHAWNAGGSLPDDCDVLCRLARVERQRWSDVWAAIGGFFQDADGKLTQRRLSKELELATARRVLASENGRKGNATRWGGHRDPNRVAMPTRLADESLPHRSSPSPSPSEEKIGSEDPISVPLPGDRAAGEPSGAALVREVFSHYRTYHPRAFPSPVPASREWRCIVARMREGSTVDDLRTAIDGYHRSPHHCGQNDRGTKYQDLGLIVRDGSHVAAGLRFATETFGPTGSANYHKVLPGVVYPDGEQKI
jgi:uncharacterized protein YdaU (DUF1376 family)